MTYWFRLFRPQQIGNPPRVHMLSHVSTHRDGTGREFWVAECGVAEVADQVEEITTTIVPDDACERCV